MVELIGLEKLVTVEVSKDRLVALHKGELISRERFLADVFAWHALFQAQVGEIFALYFDDAYEFCTALYGAWYAGKQIYLLGDIQPNTLKQLSEVVDGSAGDIPGALKTPSGIIDRPFVSMLNPSTTLLHICTSGSSGKPKIISKQLKQLMMEVSALEMTFEQQVNSADINRSNWVVSTVSHQHIYGLLFYVLWPLASNRPFLSNRLDYLDQLSEIPGDFPYLLISSPAHLRRISPLHDWSMSRVRLQTIFSSGGPLSWGAAEESRSKLGRSPLEVYGSSETGGIAWRHRSEKDDGWLPMVGVSWQVNDGLLSVQSKHLPNDEWCLTSDRASDLGNDRFELLGRNDRIVKVEEKRVSLSAIENALIASEDIVDARSILLPNTLGGRLAVVSVPSLSGWGFLQKNGSRLFNERLKTTLLQTFERVVLPRRWRHITAMPMDTQGKTSEAALMRLFRLSIPEVQWFQRSANQALLEINVDISLCVFDGHFPENPVLPGVAQIDWAVYFARECFKLPQNFVRMEALKFQKPILPSMRVELMLTNELNSGVLSFSYGTKEGRYSSGRMLFDDNYA